MRSTVTKPPSASREPPGDQPVRDRRGRRQQRVAAVQVGAGEPPHVLELAVGGARLTARRPGLESEHQRRRERPRLAAAIDDVVDRDAALLTNLPDDRLLERLPRLDETSE